VSLLARVFVNGVGLDVPAGTTTLEAVRSWNAEAADAVARGMSVITDSRGLPAVADAPIQAGAIFRVIPARTPRTVARTGGDKS
jgi:hypothetical protein